MSASPVSNKIRLWRSGELFMPSITSVELWPLTLSLCSLLLCAFFSPFLFPLCSLPAPSFPGQISLVRCVPTKRPSWHMCHVTTTLSQANRRWAQTDNNRSELSLHPLQPSQLTTANQMFAFRSHSSDTCLKTKIGVISHTDRCSEPWQSLMMSTKQISHRDIKLTYCLTLGLWECAKILNIIQIR